MYIAKAGVIAIDVIKFILQRSHSPVNNNGPHLEYVAIKSHYRIKS